MEKSKQEQTIKYIEESLAPLKGEKDKAKLMV